MSAPLPEPKIVENSVVLAEKGAAYFIDLGRQAIEKNGRFCVALSGGSTPRTMHNLLTQPPLRNAIDWHKVFIFWGDERFVPADDPENTWHMAKDTLLNYVPVPPENIFPMPTENVTPAEAALAYSQTLVTFFNDPLPRFDLIFLGMGPDGHTASLFPGHPEVVSPSENLITAVTDAPKPPPVRLTMTYRLINNAANVIFLVAGANKAEAIKGVFKTDSLPAEYPAKGILPADGTLRWLLDQKAAAEL